MARQTIAAALLLCLATAAYGSQNSSKDSTSSQEIYVFPLAVAGLAATSIYSKSNSSSSSGGDKPVNTYFRPQSMLITNDSSTEENIPGLEPTDSRAVRRAIPNLEYLSPFLTILAPFLPMWHAIFMSLGIYLPDSWPLANTGPTGDWLQLVTSTTIRGMMPNAPRPYLAPTLLVAAPQAYKALKGDLDKYSGLPAVTALPPHKQALVGAAVVAQLSRNLMVQYAPKLATAKAGITIQTEGGIILKLVVKPNGRYLVSNTTTAKILAADIKLGQHTIQLIDHFIVPKISLEVPKPKPLITEEEIKQLPEMLRVFQESLAAMPKAISQMPGAIIKMAYEQLPDHVQEVLKLLDVKD